MEFALHGNSTYENGLITYEPSTATPYVVWLGVAALAGSLGNFLVIATLCGRHTRHAARLNAHIRARNVGYVFIVNLALSDMIVTAVINPFAIIGAVKGSSLFDTHFMLCRGLAGLCIASCVVSLLSIGCISLNRYVFICHHTYYSRIYTPFNTRLICVVTWCVGFLFDVPSYSGWSSHAFDRKTQKCLWDRNFAYSYTLFFVIVGVLVPFAVINVCYVFIFYHIRQAKAQLMNLTRHSRRRGALIQALKQAKLMFLIFLVFSSCWLPYCTVLVLDKNDTFPLSVHLYASLVAHSHASFNFLIYAVANRNVRLAYIAFIERIVCWHRALRCCEQQRTPEVPVKANDIPRRVDAVHHPGKDHASLAGCCSAADADAVTVRVEPASKSPGLGQSDPFEMEMSLLSVQHRRAVDASPSDTPASLIQSTNNLNTVYGHESNLQ